MLTSHDKLYFYVFSIHILRQKEDLLGAFHQQT